MDTRLKGSKNELYRISLNFDPNGSYSLGEDRYVLKINEAPYSRKSEMIGKGVLALLKEKERCLLEGKFHPKKFVAETWNGIDDFFSWTEEW